MLVVLVALSAPGGARAQTVPHGTTQSVTATRSARWPGVLAEVGGGLLGAGISVGIAELILESSSCGPGPYACIGRGAAAVPVSILAAMVLVPGGVTLAGRTLDHQGGFGWSLLGTLAGGLAGVLVGLGLSAAAADLDSDVRTGLMVGSAIGLSVGGAVLAFELSSSSP